VGNNFTDTGTFSIVSNSSQLPQDLKEKYVFKPSRKRTLDPVELKEDEPSTVKNAISLVNPFEASEKQ
jgi:hypothetical protein